MTASSYFVKSSFRVPLPAFYSFSSPGSGISQDSELNDGSNEATPSHDSVNAQLMINAAIGGPLKRLEREIQFELETGEKETRMVGISPCPFLP